jgi:hypothetical protein
VWDPAKNERPPFFGSIHYNMDPENGDLLRIWAWVPNPSTRLLSYYSWCQNGIESPLLPIMSSKLANRSYFAHQGSCSSSTFMVHMVQWGYMSLRDELSNGPPLRSYCRGERIGHSSYYGSERIGPVNVLYQSVVN